MNFKLHKIIKSDNSNTGAEVYRLLKKGVLSGYWAPGVRLIEKDLAKTLGVSRIPIREAIKKLESDKLLSITPKKGAIVIKMSPKEIEDIYTVVGCLEGMAAKLAVNNLENDNIKKLKTFIHEMSKEQIKGDYKNWLKSNIAFHKLYINACGNSQLINLILEKREWLLRYWILACSKPGLLDKIKIHHEKIMKAFEKRDSERVRNCVEQHNLLVGKETKEYLEKLLII